MKKRVLSIVVSLSLIFGLVTTLRTTQNSKAEGYGISNPRIEEDGTVTWDCIYFGNYWQNDTNGDGKADQNDDKEPIKWRVLSVDGDDAFLLADNGLDAQPYNSAEKDIIWANSTLRKWLNDDFYNIAFNNDEQNGIVETDVINELDKDGIKDKVSLLSLTDACNANYGFNSDISNDFYDNISMESETRKVINTAYTKKAGAYSDIGAWWLRSYNKWMKYGYRVFERGEIKTFTTFFISDKDFSVRPCLHLNLSSDSWNKADTVTATGGTFPTPTPTPTPTIKISPTPKITPKPTPSATSKVTPLITTTPNVTCSPIPTPTIEPNTEPKIISQKNEPKIITAPSKVNCLTVKNNKKKLVTLSWKKVKNTTGYQVQYATNTAFAKKLVKNTKKNKLVIKNLKKKKTYSFRVRSYKINNNIKVYGNWCKAKKVKIKK